MLNEILEWVDKRSAPNKSYKYSRCVICGHAWWGHEGHNFDCWVPRLRRAVTESQKHTQEILRLGRMSAQHRTHLTAFGEGVQAQFARFVSYIQSLLARIGGKGAK